MIQAKIDVAQMHIVMDGHAQSGEPGHDLVCAAASMLVQTLAYSARRMRCKVVSELSHGHADVLLSPQEDRVSACRQRFAVIVDGLDMLAYTFPGNIHIEY